MDDVTLISAPTCCDCGTYDDVRVSTPVNGGRHHCDPCWRWRQAHGVEFDERTRCLLRRAVA